MNYNIEEHEDYLKNNMPYRLEEEGWEAMQQRLKIKVLQDEGSSLTPPKRKPFFKVALGAAAGLLLLASVYTFTRHTTETPVNGLNKGENPEQYLDKTISGLNEQELDWMHQLNENEITEQETYFEN